MYHVTFLHHSGIFIETENYCLLFDYYTDTSSSELFSPTQCQDKKLYVFVSHSHSDHYDKSILDWKESNKNIHYILSDDISLPINFPKKWVTSVKAHQQYTLDGIEITTLLSNDEGVAFIVNADNHCFFHAGDLNWWHWNGESEEFNQNIADSYRNEINTMKELSIDVAFIPVDPRLEENAFLAIDYLMKTVTVNHVFPIHFWNQFSVCQEIKEHPLAISYQQKIVQLSKNRQKFSFE